MISATKAATMINPVGLVKNPIHRNGSGSRGRVMSCGCGNAIRSAVAARSIGPLLHKAAVVRSGKACSHSRRLFRVPSLAIAEATLVALAVVV
jgi:hypothetical protein